MDLNKGFHQIPTNPDDACKTAFSSPWGKYEYVVMPFGVQNGPAAFQWLIDIVLHESCSDGYMDDILIFSKSWDEHCHHIDEVLTKLTADSK